MTGSSEIAVLVHAQWKYGQQNTSKCPSIVWEEIGVAESERGCGSVEFVGCGITILVIDAQNDWRLRRASSSGNASQLRHFLVIIAVM